MVDQNPFLDFNADESTFQQRVQLPVIQWINQDPKSRDPQCVATTGGFFSENQLTPAMRDGFFVTESGQQINGFFCETLTLALLCRRSRWLVTDADGTAQTFMGYHDAEDQLGSALAKKGRSHVQLACIVQGDEEHEIQALTLRGMAGDGVQLWDAEINKALAIPATRWKRHVAQNPAATAIPPWAFWVRFVVGEPREVGSATKKRITPPVMVLPKLEGPEAKRVLIGAFIGKTLSTLVEQWLLTDGRRWRNQWRQGDQQSKKHDVAPMSNNEPPPPQSEWEPGL